MHFLFSPFIVPVAGCLVAIVAIIGGIWSDIHKQTFRSQERIALINRGLPLDEIEKLFKRAAPDTPVKDPLRSLANARRAGIVLVSSGVGLMLFFIALAVIIGEREILSGAAIGLIPLAIGIGFFIDYGIQRRELARFGLEVAADPRL